MLHLRVVCPQDTAERVVDALSGHVGVVAIRLAGESSSGYEVNADLARECASAVLKSLHDLDVADQGMITMEPLDTALLALVARGVGLISPGDITGPGRETEFIYHPGWFSLITALVAGTAGMLSLTSSKSAALVGVFISVTTIPAAGNAAVGGVLGHWHETWQSLAQLGINLVGITFAGVVTLLVLHRAAEARAA